MSNRFNGTSDRADNLTNLVNTTISDSDNPFEIVDSVGETLVRVTDQGTIDLATADNTSISLSGGDNPFEIVDSTGNTLLRVVDTGSIDLAAGLGESISLSGGDNPFEIVDSTGNTIAKITEQGSLDLATDTNESISIDGGLNPLEIVDSAGNTLLRLTEQGSLVLPTEDNASISIDGGANPFEIVDSAGNTVLQVNTQGELLAKLVSPSAWNEIDSFWQGYAPIEACTSAYDTITTGSETISESDDAVARQCYFSQFAGNSVKAYFAHYSDHVSDYYPDAPIWQNKTQRISWGVGRSDTAWVPSTSIDFKRGTINNAPRPLVQANWEGWSDPVALKVNKNRYLVVGTAQNISGSFRLTATTPHTGLFDSAARFGGWLADPAKRWKQGEATPLDLDYSKPESCAGLRFLAVKRPVDYMVAIASDSIARGIIYTALPAPSNWGSLLNVALEEQGYRAAVWAQGSGGGAAATMVTNPQWINRVRHCTHLIITLGSNDLSYGISAITHRNNVLEIANQMVDYGIKVYVATVIPRNPYSNEQESERLAYNAWVRTKPNPFAGYFDFDLATRDPGNTRFLNPLYDGGDGIHPNTEGHKAMLSTINLEALL